MNGEYFEGVGDIRKTYPKLFKELESKYKRCRLGSSLYKQNHFVFYTAWSNHRMPHNFYIARLDVPNETIHVLNDNPLKNRGAAQQYLKKLGVLK